MVVQHYQARNYRARSSVGYLLKSAHAVLAGHIDAVVAAQELTFTQWVVLMYLRDGLALNASMLCERLHYDSGALTRVIDQLEARGWVQRQRSATDRRAVELSLTGAGRTAVEQLIPQVVDRLNWVLRDFSRAEVAELSRLLTKMIATGEQPAVA